MQREGVQLPVVSAPAPVLVQRARPRDLEAVTGVLAHYAQRGLVLEPRPELLAGELWVARSDRGVVGCGALHVLHGGVAELRSLAVRPDAKGSGVGSRLVERLLGEARARGVRRVFVLTFETAFFARHGFAALHERAPAAAAEPPPELSKPNTLGNVRMARDL